MARRKAPAGAKPPGYLLHEQRDERGSVTRARGFAIYRDALGKRRRRYFPGAFGSQESRAAYRAFLREWASDDGVEAERERRGRPATTRDTPALTIAELVDRFLAWAEREYVKNGEPTGETANLEDALDPLVALFADLPAIDFGPKRLREVRDSMLAEVWPADSKRSPGEPRLARSTINTRVRKIRQAFRWAVREELMNISVQLGHSNVATTNTYLQTLSPTAHVELIRATFQ